MRSALVAMTWLLVAMWSMVSLGACDDDSGLIDFADGGSPDGSTAEPPSEPTACPDLAPTLGADDLVISKVDPGVFIEVFNPTANDLSLTPLTYWFCFSRQYSTVESVAGTDTIPARSYLRMDWPTTWSDTSAQGDAAIYDRNDNFDDSDTIIDYLCWSGDGGLGDVPNRKTVAEDPSAGLWSGDCAGTPSEAIERLVNSDGTSASDYDSAADGSDNGDCTVP